MQAEIIQGPRASEARSIEINIFTCGVNKSTSVLTAPTAKIIIGMLIGNMINPPKFIFLLLVAFNIGVGLLIMPLVCTYYVRPSVLSVVALL